MSVLAIDAGTTGVTAVVVTPEGTIAARGYQELPQHFPKPGWVEHAPEEIWQATLEATRAADRRTADICTRLRVAGHEERVAELTGLRLDPYFSGTKLMWLAEHEPNTWALVESGRYAVGTVDSYLIARMTRGTWHVTDVSNACRTLLFDLATGDWSDELCRLFEVPRDALPELVPNWGEIATTDPVPAPKRRRPALHGRVAVAGRRADLRAGGRDLRHRRRRAVAARRAADRRLGDHA
jgi:glycerol kinase